MLTAPKHRQELRTNLRKTDLVYLRKVITDNGAEILNKEAWGLKKLAYNIEKKTSGFYSLVEFKAEPTVIAKLETAYRRDEHFPLCH